MIDFLPDEGEQRIHAMASGYARTVLDARAAAHDAGAFPYESLKELARLGLMGVKVSPQYGGLGGTNVAYAMAIREIASACSATAVTMAVTNMVADMIEMFGTEAQKARYLPPITDGTFPAAAFALSEPAFGSDAGGLQCKATPSGDGWVLQGTKMWITSGDVSGVHLVMARTSEGKSASGVSAFLVDKDTPGFTVGRHEKKMGLRGSSTVALNFDQARLPADAMLAGEGMGFRIAMTALDGGRIGIGAQALGIASSAMVSVLAHLDKRKRADRTLGTSQGVDFRIADMATRLEAAWLMVLRAAALRDAGKRMSREAAMCKVYATEAANVVCRQAVNLLGAEGVLHDGRAARALRDVRVSRIYEGTSEVQRLVIGRDLARSVQA